MHVESELWGMEISNRDPVFPLHFSFYLRPASRDGIDNCGFPACQAHGTDIGDGDLVTIPYTISEGPVYVLFPCPPFPFELSIFRTRGGDNMERSQWSRFV